ncbi:MAG: tripartite tricarboxylate transporter substrate binding protein [Pseudorhodoplanes sp.]
MQEPRRFATAATLAAALTFGLATQGLAQVPEPQQPPKQVRLVVPFAPGGAVDALARVLSQSFAEDLKQTVIVENKPGAGGNLAAELVAKSAPDGSTILLGTNGTHATNAALFKSIPFDPVADFTPIGLAVSIPHVVVVNADLPIRSIAELIQYGKDKPDALLFGSAGNGSSLHLAGELFGSMAQIQLRHVPYRGGAPAVIDLIAGRTSLMFGVVPLVLPHIKSGKLRALAVTGKNRITQLPDVPTVAEAGLPGYEATAWIGLLAPAKTPQPIVNAVNQGLRTAITRSDVRKSLEAQGFEIDPGTPEDFAAFMRNETAKWGEVVRRSGASLN